MVDRGGIQVQREGGALVPEDLVGAARALAAAAKSDRTRRAYRADFERFVKWCRKRKLEALAATPRTVALWVADRASEGAKVASIGRALVAISQAHEAAGYDSPTKTAVVREVMKGTRRKLGVAQAQKAPLVAADLKRVVGSIPEGLLGQRDRALLLLGFAGAFRRSELVSLNVADVVFTDDGAEVTLRHSKTDQEAAGRKIGIPWGTSPQTCPVRSLQAWLEAAGISEGPLFRDVTRAGVGTSRRARGASRLSDRAVARMIQRRAKAAGLKGDFGGHSLRAGLATSAAKAGKTERAIMNQTGHRSAAMVRRYIRDADLFTENAAAGLL